MTTTQALKRAQELFDKLPGEKTVCWIDESVRLIAAALLEAQAEAIQEWLFSTPHQRIDHEATLRAQAEELRKGTR